MAPPDEPEPHPSHEGADPSEGGPSLAASPTDPSSAPLPEESGASADPRAGLVGGGALSVRPGAATAPAGAVPGGGQAAGGGRAPPAPLPGVLGGLSEHFSLLSARQISKTLGERERAALQAMAAAALQKRKAAEALWYMGHRAEGLGLAEQALQAARTAESIAGTEGPATATEPAPKGPTHLDSELTRHDESRFHQLVRVLGAVERTTSPAALSPRRLTWLVWRRRAQAVVIAIAFVAALAFWIYEPPRIEATATNQQPAWPAAFVIDEDLETEWQGDDGARPTLDLALIPPRQLEGVRLLNGHNRWFNDRAVRRYRLELRSRGETVASFDGEFTELSSEPDWVHHDLAGENVDQVRLVVVSFHGTGSALAEIDLVEVGEAVEDATPATPYGTAVAPPSAPAAPADAGAEDADSGPDAVDALPEDAEPAPAGSPRRGRRLELELVPDVPAAGASEAMRGRLRGARTPRAE